MGTGEKDEAEWRSVEIDEMTLHGGRVLNYLPMEQLPFLGTLVCQM